MAFSSRIYCITCYIIYSNLWLCSRVDCGSRLHALVGANQKRGAQRRFDFAEALADRRSGDMFTVGHRSNGALFNHANEQLERGGMKPQHGSYFLDGLIECSFEPRFPRWQHHEWLLFPPASARHNSDCLRVIYSRR